MWDTGHRLPTQASDGRSTCFCGAMLTIGAVPDHVLSALAERVAHVWPCSSRQRLFRDQDQAEVCADAPAPNYALDYNKPPTMPMLGGDARS
jgi:hypothetical protein